MSYDSNMIYFKHRRKYKLKAFLSHQLNNDMNLHNYCEHFQTFINFFCLQKTIAEYVWDLRVKFCQISFHKSSSGGNIYVSGTEKNGIIFKIRDYFFL